MSSVVTVIEPDKKNTQYWKEVWKFRELIFFVSGQNLLARYKQTTMGIVWAILQPLFVMVILTVVFGKFARFPKEAGIPYPVMVFAGVLPWQLFTSIFTTVANSFVTNMNLITKVYFPRVILPFSIALTSLIDFLLAGIIMVGLMAWFKVIPHWHILLLPLFILLAIMAALGAGLYLACLGVKYRDFRFVVPLVMQIGINITPVGYTSKIVPEQWKLLYSINPMVGIIEGCRWCIFGGTTAIYVPGVVMSVLVSSFLLYIGLRHIRKTEKWFADVI